MRLKSFHSIDFIESKRVTYKIEIKDDENGPKKYIMEISKDDELDYIKHSNSILLLKLKARFYVRLDKIINGC